MAGLHRRRGQRAAGGLPVTRKHFLLGLAGMARAAPALAAIPADGAPKVLLVVAHPDDEYAFAATTYRIAKELHGIVDQVVITNGEAGFRYAQLAESYYGTALAREDAGRNHLPAIRRQETLAAGRILGIRNHHFLGQKDARFTLDPSEAQRIWDTGAVRAFLSELLEREQYPFVFVMLPTAQTHGHHQAAALLALEAASSLPEAIRPVVLGAEPARSGEPVEAFKSHGIAQPWEGAPVFAFDRRSRFGPDGTLNYQIVVNWMVAEHKSQGLFQTERHDEERYYVFAAGGKESPGRAEALFRQLRAPSPGRG